MTLQKKSMIFWNFSSLQKKRIKYNIKCISDKNTQKINIFIEINKQSIYKNVIRHCQQINKMQFFWRFFQQ
jgi:hypothetical protein